ncbi:MAG: hypothetical protein HQ553_06175 [Chloroflexi bacterium]|nr:hypothetical protein [Chloroflexota bacterium]
MCVAFFGGDETSSHIYAEALTNVWKHANASQTEVEVITEAEMIVLSVSDDGIGFDHHSVLKEGALGLLGMRERAQLAGGKITVSSSPGKGTKITVILPLFISQTEVAVSESTDLPLNELKGKI